VSKLDLYQQEYYPSPFQQTWIEFRRNHVALIGLWCLLAFLIVGILAPPLMPYPPLEQSSQSLLMQPAWHPSGSLNHLLGTDMLGRDMLSRIVHGTQTTLLNSILLVFLAMMIGVAMGAYAGLNQGFQSSVLSHLLEAIVAIPMLLLAIIIIAILGTGLSNSMWAIGLALVPQFALRTRDFVVREAKKQYVTAARLDGAGKFHLFFHSILPNMFEKLVVQITQSISNALLNISALGFLGLGAKDTTTELGAMLSESVQATYSMAWHVLLPGVTIFAIVVSVNLVGDGLQSALKNRLRH
jgi:cationic peptide transport system permease protein